MTVIMTCHQCGNEIRVDPTAGADTVACPGCQASLLIPTVQLAIDSDLFARQSDELTPGTELGGFVIERLLSRGGMGAVYVARQVSMDRTVALKILSPALAQNQENVDRFNAEVRLQARLEHPYIVTAFEAGFEKGVYYLALALVDGISVQDHLKTAGALPEAQALRLTRHVAQALSYAWETHRILHRDIKPANLMMTRQGEARILDLGLSKCLTENSALTASQIVCGTPHYMSPEQARGDRSLDCRSDMYALGATLHHMLTGAPLFQGDSTLEILYKQVYEPPPDPGSAFNVGTRRLLSALLAKDPAGRPASWKDVVRDLDTLCAGKPPPPQLPPPAPLVPSVPASPPATDTDLKRGLSMASRGILLGCAIWGAVLTGIVGIAAWGFVSCVNVMQQGCHVVPSSAAPQVRLDELTPRVGRRYTMAEDRLTIGPQANGGFWLSGSGRSRFKLEGWLKVTDGAGGLLLLPANPQNAATAWSNDLADALRFALEPEPTPQLIVRYHPLTGNPTVLSAFPVEAIPPDGLLVAVTVEKGQLTTSVGDSPDQTVSLPWKTPEKPSPNVYWGLYSGPAATVTFVETPIVTAPEKTPGKSYQIIIKGPDEPDQQATPAAQTPTE